MNPRVLAWLRAVALDGGAIERTPEGMAHVTVGDYSGPWGALYIVWIAGQCAAWADSLGCRSYSDARRKGYTHDDFDRWLARRWP